MEALKKRWRERRENYECAERDVSTTSSSSTWTKNQDPICFEGDNYHRVEEWLSNCEACNANSLLLPTICASLSMDKVTICVEGKCDTVTKTAAKVSVEDYISQIAKERDTAIQNAQMYRNQVDELMSKNRKLFCSMNDRIDAVNKFWRNNIAEGATRGGLCVRTAIQQNTKKL